MIHTKKTQKTLRVNDLNKNKRLKFKQRKGSFTKRFKLAIGVRCDHQLYERGQLIELEKVGERAFNILKEYRE